MAQNRDEIRRILTEAIEDRHVVVETPDREFVTRMAVENDHAPTPGGPSATYDPVSFALILAGMIRGQGRRIAETNAGGAKGLAAYCLRKENPRKVAEASRTTDEQEPTQPASRDRGHPQLVGRPSFPSCRCMGYGLRGRSR